MGYACSGFVILWRQRLQCKNKRAKESDGFCGVYFACIALHLQVAVAKKKVHIGKEEKDRCEQLELLSTYHLCHIIYIIGESFFPLSGVLLGQQIVDLYMRGWMWNYNTSHVPRILEAFYTSAAHALVHKSFGNISIGGLHVRMQCNATLPFTLSHTIVDTQNRKPKASFYYY